MDILHDDIMIELLHTLASIDGALDGLRLRDAKNTSSRDALALTATCRRIRALFKSDASLSGELAARGRSDIVPLGHSTSPYAHKAHADAEAACRKLVKAFGPIEASFALHCASRHCRRARKDVLRQTLGAVKLSPVKGVNQTVDLLSCSADGRVVFFTSRSSREERHFLYRAVEGRVVAHIEVEHKLVFHLSTSHCGGKVAWVATSPMSGDPVSICLWSAETGTRHIACPAPTGRAKNAQAVWWAGADLWAAYSTTFVDLSDLGHGEISSDEHYFFVQLGSADSVDTTACPFAGRLITCSAASCDSQRVVALVRSVGDEYPCAFFHNTTRQNRSLLPTQLRHVVAASISPMGDLVACVGHLVPYRPSAPGGWRSPGLELLELLGGDRYASTRRKSLMRHLCSGGPKSAPALSDSDSSSSDDYFVDFGYGDDLDAAGEVYRPFSLEFANTGSHVVIVDRRPRPASFKLVVVDVSNYKKSDLAMTSRGYFQRAERDSFARCVKITTSGVFLAAKKGLLVLSLREGGATPRPTHTL